MYVLLHGFDDPNIIMLLNDIGVYVDVVVKIQTQDYAVFPVVSRVQWCRDAEAEADAVSSVSRFHIDRREGNDQSNYDGAKIHRFRIPGSVDFQCL